MVTHVETEKCTKLMSELKEIINTIEIDQIKSLSDIASSIKIIENTTKKNSELLQKLDYEINNKDGAIPTKLNEYDVEHAKINTHIKSWNKYVWCALSLVFGLIVYIIKNIGSLTYALEKLHEMGVV